MSDQLYLIMFTFQNDLAVENAMSEQSQEITGKRPCDGLRVDLKRCLLQVLFLSYLD